MKTLLLLIVVGLSAALTGCATKKEAIGSAEFYPLLRLAAGAGDELSARMLLEHGADPTGFRDYEACYKKYGYGTEPSSHLFVAAYAGELGVVKLLAEAGADLNALEGEMQTPLWAACAHGHIEIVRYLISKGARQDIKGEGLEPIRIAEKRGHLDIVALLKKQPNQAPEPTAPSGRGSS